MSSERRSENRSPAPDDALTAESPRPRASAALARDRGASLIEGLERHLPGSHEHAEATGSYAFAAAVELGSDRRLRGQAGQELDPSVVDALVAVLDRTGSAVG